MSLSHLSDTTSRPQAGGATSAGHTKITEGVVVRTVDLERLCELRDPRCVEFACFLLHSSNGDAKLAIYRAIDGMFDDPNVRATQEETAECVRAVALAALDLQLSERVESAKVECWPEVSATE